MADQIEKIRLEAEDVVTPAVTKANAAVDTFEKKVESALSKVVRITDQSRTSVQRLITSMERQAELAGKSGSERLIVQQQHLLEVWKKEPAAIDAITKSMEKQIEIAKKAEAAQAEIERKRKELDEAQKRTEAGRQAQGWASDPFGTLKGKAAEALTAIGPVGGAVAGLTAAFAALSVGAYAAAKSLGEYGIQVRDVSLRTGLTTKEVGQFSFAAKAAGSDISAFEGAMRKLSQGLNEGSEEGKKAREALSELGIRTRELNADIRPTRDIFLQISDQLRAIESPTKRNAEAIRLFGRQGVELVPVLVQLRENFMRARELGLGSSEEDIKRWEQYHKTITEIDSAWDRLVRKMKQGVVAKIEWVWGTRDWGKEPGEETGEDSLMPNLRRFLLHGKWAAPGPQGKNMTEPKVPAGLGDELAANDFVAGVLKRRNGTLEGAEANLTRLKEAASKARTEFESLENSGAGMAAVTKAKKAMDATEASLKTQTELVKILQKEESKRIELLEKTRDLEMRGAQYQAYVIGNLPGQVLQQYFYDERGIQRLDNGGYAGGAPRRRVPSLRRGGEQNRFAWAPLEDNMLAPGMQEWGTETVFVSPDEVRSAPYTAAERERDKAYGAGLLGRDRDVESRRLSWLHAEEAATIRITELRSGPGGELETAQKVAQIRQAAIEAEYRVTGDMARQQEQTAHNQLDLQVQAAEIQHKQWTEVQGKASGLAHTLFTSPRSFNSSLFGTVRDAALAPVERALGGMVASAFTGGNPQQDPIKIATDLNTAVTAQNSAAMVGLTAVLAAQLGIGMPSIAAPSVPGLGGVALPTLSTTAPAASTRVGGGGLPRFAEGGIVTGPSIVGEAGPELVIPLDPRFSVGGVRTQPSRDSADKYRGFMGLLRESQPDWANWLEPRLKKMWGDFDLAGQVVGFAAAEVPDVLGGGISLSASDILREGMRSSKKIPSFGAWREAHPRGGVEVFDLSDMQAAIEGRGPLDRNWKTPGGKFKPPSDRVADAVNNPRVIDLLKEDIWKGTKTLDKAPWYATSPLYKEFMQVWGPEEGEEKFIRFIDYIAGTSARNPVASNIKVGSWFWNRDIEGLEHMKPQKGSGYGSLASDTHFTNARLIKEDRWRSSVLKKPKEPSFGENLMGNFDPLTADVHFTRRVGMLTEDPRWLQTLLGKTETKNKELQAFLKSKRLPRGVGQIRPQDFFAKGKLTIQEALEWPTMWEDAPRENEYPTLERMMQNIVRDMNADKDRDIVAHLGRPLTTADAQAFIWYAGKDFTGVRSKAEPFMQTLGARIAYTADRMGVSPDVIKRLLIEGKIPLLQHGGVMERDSIAMLHKQEMVLPPDLSVALQSFLRGGANGPAMLGNVARLFQGDSGTTSLNTQATMANTQAVMALAGILASGGFGGGVGAAALPSYIVSSGGGNFYSAMPVPEAAGGGMITSAASLPLADRPISSHALLGSLLRSQRGGLFSSGGLGGLKQYFSKGNWWNEETAANIAGVKGDIASVATSKAGQQLMLAGGTMLTSAGVFGKNRGTALGIAESTGGGAMLGASIGTMIAPGLGTAIGAGVGAVVGFGVGVGEKIAGAVAPEEQIRQQVKALYGVDIRAQGVLTQIKQMADQRYGGSYSLAIHGPDVRQLILLYAQSKGVNMPLSSTVPHAGMLAEQGGQMFQEASYYNGMAYTHSSGLPTLAGLQTSSYPSQPIALQLHVGDQGAADFLAGRVVTPDFVQGQWAAANSASAGRAQNAAVLNQPGLIIS
jgi:hypothetical protein